MSDNVKLIKKCQKGSHEAIDKLISEYSGLIYGICLRYCKNKFEADDLLQDCLIRIIENIEDFKFKGSFDGWIRRLTVNTAINFLKKKNRNFCENIDNLNTYKEVIEEDVISKMNADAIIGLINDLPDGYKTVFNLHVIEGFKHVEIAEMLNITDSTSRTQYKKAREILIQRIKEINK